MFLKAVVTTIPKGCIEFLGRTAFMAIGTVLSPTWYLLEQTLKPFLDLESCRQSGLTTSAICQLISQLRAAGPHQLAHELIPSLLLCLVISLSFLFLCSFLGKYFTNRLMQHLAA